MSFLAAIFYFRVCALRCTEHSAPAKDKSPTSALDSELPLWEKPTSPSEWGEIEPTTCIVRCPSGISHWSSFVPDIASKLPPYLVKAI